MSTFNAPRTHAFKVLLLSIGMTPQLALADAAGKAFNPDVSVNVLGLFTRDTLGPDSRTSADHNGLRLQEAELQFFSDVDPYLTANALFSVSQTDGGKEFGIDPEEVFIETVSLPWVTLKAGKFKAALGKHNTLHTHAFPFIDAPSINRDLLGDEGLNEAGLSASVLIPTSWFTELTLQGMGSNNDTFFNSANSGDISQVASLKNLWELSTNSTLEWSAYGTQGANQYASRSRAYGSDLSYKWRPAQGGKYTAIIWSTEYLNGTIKGRASGERLGGAATWIQYQFAERWWIQARAEFEGLPHSDSLPMKRKQSLLLGFYPTEFSGFRLQGDRQLTSGLPKEYRIALQWNITIGAHPAHSY